MNPNINNNNTTHQGQDTSFDARAIGTTGNEGDISMDPLVKPQSDSELLFATIRKINTKIETKAPKLSTKQKKELHKNQILFGIETIDDESINLAEFADMPKRLSTRSDIIEFGVKKQPQCLDKFVIKKNANWKNGFDILMLILSCYNVFANAY
jgi:hypothetical protein